MTSEQQKSKPVAEVRIGGVKAAIWKNETDKGPRYSVTFERVYKDGDTWGSSSSFNGDELHVLSKVADLAHTKIHELKNPQDWRVERAFGHPPSELRSEIGP